MHTPGCLVCHNTGNINISIIRKGIQIASYMRKESNSPGHLTANTYGCVFHVSQVAIILAGNEQFEQEDSVMFSLYIQSKAYDSSCRAISGPSGMI